MIIIHNMLGSIIPYNHQPIGVLNTAQMGTKAARIEMTVPVRPQSVAGRHLRSIQNGPGVYLATGRSHTRKNEDVQGM